MIKPLFKTDSLMANVNLQMQKIEQAIIASLTDKGDMFVTDCRNENTYFDRTGNLRSSIGYFIFKGNELIEENLNGNSEGLSSAKEVVSDIPKKEGVFYLIGVAGMNYAAAVESKGYNVISNQTLLILPLIEKDMHRIISKN